MPGKQIPKLYYSVSEVSEMTGVKPHVLRFWEKEFPMLRPKRGRSGNRSYREREIELIRAIKHLLYEEKYTIQGAVERLRQERSLSDSTPDTVQDSVEATNEAPPAARTEAPGSVLGDVRKLLLELKELLETEG
jgi:DNA-binding transcriptional MerR regulator